MNFERERVISISLTEGEWQAFVARHPRPVDWLRECILGELEDGRAEPRDPVPPSVGLRSRPLN
jgi:hypothetical protein